jgi:hypothetical protein
LLDLNFTVKIKRYKELCNIEIAYQKVHCCHVREKKNNQNSLAIQAKKERMQTHGLNHLRKQNQLDQRPGHGMFHAWPSESTRDMIDCIHKCIEAD